MLPVGLRKKEGLIRPTAASCRESNYHRTSTDLG